MNFRGDNPTLPEMVPAGSAIDKAQSGRSGTLRR